MVLVQLGLHFLLKRHMDNSAGSSLLSVFPSLSLPLLSLKHCGEQAQTPLTFTVPGDLSQHHGCGNRGSYISATI